MDLFNNLKNKYLQILKPAQQTLGNVGQNVGQQFSNLGTAVHNNVTFQPTIKSPVPNSMLPKPGFVTRGLNSLAQGQVNLEKNIPLYGQLQAGLRNTVAPIARNFMSQDTINQYKGFNQPNKSGFAGNVAQFVGEQVPYLPLMMATSGLTNPVTTKLGTLIPKGTSIATKALSGAVKQGINFAPFGWMGGLEYAKTPEDRLKNIAKSTAGNIAFGGVIGGGGGALKGLGDEISALFPKASKEVQQLAIQQYNRSLKTGQFIPQTSKSLKTNLQDWVRQSVGKKPGEPVFHSDLQKAMQGGFIKPDEFIPLRKNMRPGGYTNVPSIDNPLLKKGGIPFQDQQAIAGDLSQPKVPIKSLKPVLNKTNTPVSSKPIIPQSEPLPWEAPGYKPTTSIPTDTATQIRAQAGTVLNNQGKGGLGGLSPEVITAFQDWVNARRATKVEGLVKNKEFSDLNNKGIQGIFEFQSGNKTGRFGDVKNYFDNKYAELKKAGVDFKYKQDYLPQLWDNTEQEIQQVFGRSLGTRPSFTLDSIIKNYEEGIKAGLKPRFNNISDLAGWYEQRANKTLADKRFFDGIGKDGFIQPSGKAPQDWITLDPDRFPKVKVNTAEGNYVGAYKAPPELANIINNYLRDPQFKALETIANFVSRAKNITLNFGIPYTAINSHGVNILARHTLFGTGGNPVTRFLTGSKYMIYPRSAEKFVDQQLARAPQAIKNGLTMSAEDYIGLGKQAENVTGQFSKRWENAFGTPLFNKMIPAMKISSYENLVKGKMNPKTAAKLVNNVYGGINWEQMGRNRDFQNLLRSIFLAPDWGETSLRMGGNLVKAFTPWGRETAARYRTMTATLVGSFVALNIANKLSSGHYAYENEPGHTFEFEMGYTQDGQKRYLRPYGTAADFIRLPYDTIIGLKRGDPSPVFRAISNRFSIPLSSTMHLMTNTDYTGKKIYGRDSYGNDIPAIQAAGGIGSEALGLVGFPSFGKNVIDIATGKQGMEEGLTQGAELPFRYTNIGKSNVSKQLDPFVNLQGKELYDFNKNLQGQNKLSENQLEGVRSSDNKAQAIQDVLDIRKMKSDETKMKENLLNNQQSNSEGMAYAAEKTVGSKTYYTDNGTVKTIDLTPPTKGQGIDAFSNQNWGINKALDVYKSNLSQAKKNELYQRLNVDPKDMEYAYKANKSIDIKTQYTLSQNLTHDQLLERMMTGRVESIAGDMFAANGLLDKLNEKGLLSDAETKALKAIKLDKNGKSIAKAAKAKKLKKISFKGMKAIKLKLPKMKKVKAIKAKKVKVYKLKSRKLKKVKEIDLK